MPEPNEWLLRLRALTDDYLAQAEACERKGHLLAGAFGMRGGPADDPCHERYAAQLKELTEEMLRASPGSAELREVLAEVYTAPLRPCPRSAYWMLQAVQGLTEPAIARLDPADARALGDGFRADYPRRKRLPVQKKLLRLLEQKAENK